MLFYLALFFLSFLLIGWAGASLVRSLTALSRLFGLSEYLVAFLLMSFITSIPDLFIGISAAIQNVPQISFGDAMGASIIKLTFIIGAVAAISGGISTESKISKKNFFLVSLFAFMPLLLVLDGVLSRGDGILLIMLFLIYIMRLFREKDYFNKQVWNNGKHHGALKHLGVFFAASSILIFGAYSLIWSAKFVAEILNMPNVLFGLLIVSLGTTLPEIIFGFRAVRLKHTNMMLGNALGSIAFNTTIVLGVVSLIHPIEITINGHIGTAAAFLLLALILFNIFAYTRSTLSRKEGIMLLCLYVAFLYIELMLFI